MIRVSHNLIPYIVGSRVGLCGDGCCIKAFIRRFHIFGGYGILHGVTCGKRRGRCVYQLYRTTGIGHVASGLSRNLAHHLRNLVCHNLCRTTCNGIIEVVQCRCDFFFRCCRFDCCKRSSLCVRHGLLVSSDVIICIYCVDCIHCARLSIFKCFLCLCLYCIHSVNRSVLCRGNGIGRSRIVDRSLAVCDRLRQRCPVCCVIVRFGLCAKQRVEVVLRGRLRIRKLLRFGLHRVHGVNRSVLCRGNGIGRSRILDSCLAVCDRLRKRCPVGCVIVILVLSALQCIEVCFC